MEGAGTNPGGLPLGGKALLNGFILTGWRAGAQVHAKCVVKDNCVDAPPGRCFKGTITIEQVGGKQAR